MLLLKLSVRRNIPPLALFTPAPKNFLSVTLKEAEGDSSLVKQVKAPVLLNLKEWYQDDDIQKLMKIGMLLDPQFKKIPYLTEVGQTAIWLQARDERAAIIRLTKIKISRGISIFP